MRESRAKRWVRRHATGNRQRVRNWLNRRAVTRGRSPLPERLTRPVRSSLPGYRNRVNPATGCPRRDDRQLGKARDRSPPPAPAGRAVPHGRGGPGEHRIQGHRQAPPQDRPH